MARSHLKTPLSIVRKILGPYHGQLDNFCKLTGLSKSLVEKTCAGFRPLSDDSAAVVANATGVDYQWMLGKSKSKPKAQDGMPFTKEKFLQHRARMKGEDAGSSGAYLVTAEILRIIAAVNHDPLSAPLLAYRLEKFASAALADLGPLTYRAAESDWFLRQAGAQARGDTTVVYLPQATAQTAPQRRRKPRRG
jgi:hypothetical protein